MGDISFKCDPSPSPCYPQQVPASQGTLAQRAELQTWGLALWGEESWGMGQFIFLDHLCASCRGWPGSGGAEMGAWASCLSQEGANLSSSH